MPAAERAEYERHAAGERQRGREAGLSAAWRAGQEDPPVDIRPLDRARLPVREVRCELSAPLCRLPHARQLIKRQRGHGARCIRLIGLPQAAEHLEDLLGAHPFLKTIATIANG